MKKHTYLIIELLQSFSKKELKRFQQMVAAPFLNSDDKLVELLEILITHCIKYFEQNFDLTIAYNQLFHTKFKKLDTKQTNLIHSKMSLLLGLAQQFLMLQTLQDNATTKTALLQEALLAKKQYRLYEQSFKKEKKALQGVAKGIEYYEHQYILENNHLNYYQATGSISNQNNLYEVKESLSFNYLFNQLDAYLLELSLAEFSTAHKVDYIFFNALKPLLEIHQIKAHPLIKVYQCVIDLLRRKTDKEFFILIKNLHMYASVIPKNSLINFYNSAVNFCALQLRNGKKNYGRHLLDLYKTMDEKDLLFDKYQIHLGNLRNIIIQSCKLKEFDWAIEMLNKYEVFIPLNIRQAIKNYYLGSIAYFKKDYQLAIDYLFSLPNINLSHDINRRTTIIKAYYQLDVDYLETTQTLFRSFEKYIRDHKSLTSKSKTSYKNFIRTLINLYRIKHNATKMQLESVKIKLKAQKLNSNKSWLLEKVGELSDLKY